MRHRNKNPTLRCGELLILRKGHLVRLKIKNHLKQNQVYFPKAPLLASEFQYFWCYKEKKEGLKAPSHGCSRGRDSLSSRDMQLQEG